jgi:hypothetical protein
VDASVAPLQHTLQMHVLHPALADQLSACRDTANARQLQLRARTQPSTAEQFYTLSYNM